ncbi:hypothetical protein P5673_030092 [Acropora cervicornis]|uniref:Uncharacterized protein n=1 Tax=Acropora cervicornis TaxID=6130 RepID=A0AAD9PV21_ACRCE|nr:hypothetical protein P5673_030092 [Acropora cervicornis]
MMDYLHCNLICIVHSPAECMIFYKLHQLAGETIEWSWVAFEGLFETSDFFSFCHTMQSSAQSSPTQKCASSGSEDLNFADDPDFTVGGINLIIDIPPRPTKPTLYATGLMSHLFGDEEMRQGKCIRVKFSERVLERSWSAIRTSMNQKCLNKLKQYRHICVVD